MSKTKYLSNFSDQSREGKQRDEPIGIPSIQLTVTCSKLGTKSRALGGIEFSFASYWLSARLLSQLLSVAIAIP